MAPPSLLGSLDMWLHKWRARLQMLLGLNGAAQATFEAMRQRWPGHAYPVESLAHLAAADNQTTRALALMRQVTEMEPHRAGAWFNLAFLLEKSGMPDQAEGAFRKALELDPDIDRAWYGLALCLIQQRRLEEAEEALRRNTRMQPMSPYGWYQMARVQLDLGRPEDAERTITHLEGFEPKVAAQLRRETGLLRSPGRSA